MSLSSTGTHLFGWCEIVEYADSPRCSVLISSPLASSTTWKLQCSSKTKRQGIAPCRFSQCPVIFIQCPVVFPASCLFQSLSLNIVMKTAVKLLKKVDVLPAL